MKQNHPWYKKWYYYIVALAVVLSGFLPQILDEIYPQNGFWFTETTFSRENLLAFYGSYLAFLGSVVLGALALWQNQKIRDESSKNSELLNRFNERILRLQEQDETPLMAMAEDKLHNFQIELSFLNCINPAKVTRGSTLGRMRFWMYNCTNSIAKSVIVRDFSLYTFESCYKSRGSTYNPKRFCVPANTYHFSFDLARSTVDADNNKYNQELKESSPGEISPDGSIDPITNVHFIAEIELEIRNKHNIHINEQIRIHFTRRCGSANAERVIYERYNDEMTFDIETEDTPNDQ